MSTLAQLEQELAERQDDINTCNEMLELEPSDEDALQTKELLEEQITDLNVRIAAERRKQDAAPPPPPPANGVPPPAKFDMSKHPKFQQGADTPSPLPEDAQPANFEVRDLVMAKYSDDKQWYQATIVSKTGSSTDPVYTVSFKGYGNTETKRKYEIRAIENKKRKADGTPAASATPQAPASPRPAANNGSVISAAPSVDATLVQKREPSKVSDGPTRMAPEPKKLKGNKVLDKQKSSWNDWQKNGPKKSFSAPKKKDSMFRTQDKPNTQAGFSVSGKPEARLKWNYGREDEE